MTSLDDLLSNWKKDKSIEALFDAGLFENQQAIQNGLKNKKDSEFNDALKTLSEIATALTSYIEGLDAEKTEVKKQIDQSVQSAKACLSYGLTSNIENRGNDKE